MKEKNLKTKKYTHLYYSFLKIIVIYYTKQPVNLSHFRLICSMLRKKIYPKRYQIHDSVRCKLLFCF